MTPGAELRVRAARTLTEVALEGASLRVALARGMKGIDEARDRALLSALVFAGARWWLRMDGALGHMLSSPLKSDARVLQALLVSGLVQLSIMRMPAYAVVTTSVEAARALGFPGHAKLVNAILRRWQRDHERIEAKLDQVPQTRWSQQEWLIDALRSDWPQHWQLLLEASNVAAPLVLRVNRRRSSVADLQQRLEDTGLEVQRDDALPDALILAQSTDVRALPGFAQGDFSVQDGSAQAIVGLMQLRDGQHVLDACAAPGGKAAHMLEHADVDLLALDVDAVRVAGMADNLERLGLQARLLAADATNPDAWWDGRAFDRILIDAPCSSTGVMRRQPDVRLHRRAADIPRLAAQQLALLDALWPLLAPGGRLVYATCSLLGAENGDVLRKWLGGREDAQVVTLPASFGHAAGAGRQWLTGEAGRDGFYYAALEKSG